MHKSFLARRSSKNTVNNIFPIQSLKENIDESQRRRPRITSFRRHFVEAAKSSSICPFPFHGQTGQPMRAKVLSLSHRRSFGPLYSSHGYHSTVQHDSDHQSVMCSSKPIPGHCTVLASNGRLAEKCSGRCPARDLNFKETNDSEDCHRRGQDV